RLPIPRTPGPTRRSRFPAGRSAPVVLAQHARQRMGRLVQMLREQRAHRRLVAHAEGREDGAVDRKSTRLNSSHVKISYAVFCLNNPTCLEPHTLSLHDALPISASHPTNAGPDPAFALSGGALSARRTRSARATANGPSRPDAA